MVCAAPFRTNFAIKDYIMKIFPRDAKRRTLWNKCRKKLDTNEKCISLHICLVITLKCLILFCLILIIIQAYYMCIV